jgi:hypothetical protein
VTRIEYDDLGLDEMELAVGFCPWDILALVEAVLDHLDDLSPERLEIGEIGGIYHPETFCESEIVQSVAGPRGEIVVEFGIVEAGAEKAAPEMIVDALLWDFREEIPQFLQVLGLFPRCDRNEGAIPQRERVSSFLSGRNDPPRLPEIFNQRRPPDACACSLHACSLYPGDPPAADDGLVPSLPSILLL